jgi:hypothetical protein
MVLAASEREEAQNGSDEMEERFHELGMQTSRSPHFYNRNAHVLLPPDEQPARIPGTSQTPACLLRILRASEHLHRL